MVSLAFEKLAGSIVTCHIEPQLRLRYQNNTETWQRAKAAKKFLMTAFTQRSRKMGYCLAVQ